MKSTIDLSHTLLSVKLNGCLTSMNDNLASIKRKVEPIAEMSEKVRLCKDNINTALEQVNLVTANISEQEDIYDILVEKRAMINSEFDVYIKSIWRAMDLITYFEIDLAYFKDSYAITDKLVSFKTIIICPNRNKQSKLQQRNATDI